MNLRNISGNQITIWVVLLLGLVVALVVGSAVGNSDMRFVAGVIAAIPAAVIVLKLKTNIWVLMPISWSLVGSLPWFPLPFSVQNLCYLVVIVSFTLFLAVRILPWKRELSNLDYLIYINLAYLATVYVRNPAGVLIFQTDIVGGKPYMAIALAFGAYLILSRVKMSEAIAKVLPLLMIVPAWGVGILDLIGQTNIQIGYLLNSFYTGVGVSSVFGAITSEAEIGSTRLTGLQSAGYASVLFLCARYNIITLISPLYPWRLLMLMTAISAIFLSGFRSLFLFAIVAFVLSAILRRQLNNLCVFIAVGFLALLSIIFLQGNALQMPLTMQRTLSWIPGDWDPEAVQDAQNSTEWRVDMWRWAWNDERILRDKVWGQGFGLTIEDMNLIATSLAAGGGGAGLLGGSDRENFMLTGSFHSGPLSSVKFIGFVGLALYYPLICYMAVLAWRLCQRAQGTNAVTLALFVGIPIIYEPFNFVVIFGALEGSYPQTLFWAGLLMMTQRYLERLKPSVPSEVKVAFEALGRPNPSLQPVLRRQALMQQPL